MTALLSNRGVEKVGVAGVRLPAYTSAALAGLALLHGVVGMAEGSRLYLNVVTPLGVLVVFAIAGMSLVRQQPLLWLTSLPWFCFATAAYYGLGPLLQVMIAEGANRESLTDMMWRGNLLSVVGSTITIAICQILLGRAGNRLGLADARRHGHRTERELHMAWRWSGIFLVVGMAVKWLLVVPASTGATAVVLPTSVRSLQEFVYVGAILLGWLSTQSVVAWIPLLAITALHAVEGMIGFSKTGAILAIAMPLLGRCIGSGRQRDIAVLLMEIGRASCRERV